MESTYIQQTPKSRIRSATRFGGINRSDGIPLGEWDALQDFDLSEYPAMRTCIPYAYSDLPSGITGYTYRNGGIVYTVSDGIYIGGEKTAIDGLTSGSKTLVSIGAYIVILPDWVVVNTAAEESDSSVIAAKGAVLTGTLMEYNSNITKPSVSIFKRFYVDAPTDDVMASGLSVGDSVKLSWMFGKRHMERQVTVNSIGEEDYTADGMTSICFDTSEMPNTQWFYAENRAMEAFRIIHITGATIQRVMPDLDYVVEYNNRLWGCSSKNHEIYCSKLGEPLVWGAYSGISTDSWAATVGTDGDFTGACVYNGCILFFKEDCVHSVYGTKASNFTITTYTVRGVQKGSSKSLCISEGMLYYKAPEGIFAFNGSASSRADMKLSCDITQTACGTADDRYIVMLMSDGMAYYYDKLHSVWYTRRLADVISAHNVKGKLYAVTKSKSGDMRQVLLTGAYAMDSRQEVTTFEAISGELCRGELVSSSTYSASALHTVIRKLTMSLEEQHETAKSLTAFTLSVQYDGGEWKAVYSYNGSKEASDGNVITLAPIIPMRCQRMRFKLSGTVTLSDGTADTMPFVKLYGVFIDTEEASEIGGKH